MGISMNVGCRFSNRFGISVRFSIEIIDIIGDIESIKRLGDGFLLLLLLNYWLIGR